MSIAKVIEGKNQTAILEELIMKHLDGYFAGRRGHGEDSEAEAAA